MIDEIRYCKPLEKYAQHFGGNGESLIIFLTGSAIHVRRARHVVQRLVTHDSTKLYNPWSVAKALTERDDVFLLGRVR